MGLNVVGIENLEMESRYRYRKYFSVLLWQPIHIRNATINLSKCNDREKIEKFSDLTINNRSTCDLS